jgi:3-oxoacyl-[acyl-carrier-protein] synthase II
MSGWSRRTSARSTTSSSCDGAAKQALDDANWAPDNDDDRCATGVMIGSGIGGLSGIADTASLLLKERGPRRCRPSSFPAA